MMIGVLAKFIGQITIRTAVQQQLQHGGMSPVGGDHQRRPACDITAVDTGTPLDQHSGNRQSPVSGTDLERRYARSTRQADIRTCIEQQTANFQAFVGDGKIQGRCSKAGDKIDGSTLFDQKPGNCRLAASCSTVQCRHVQTVAAVDGLTGGKQLANCCHISRICGLMKIRGTGGCGQPNEKCCDESQSQGSGFPATIGSGIYAGSRPSRHRRTTGGSKLPA